MHTAPVGAREALVSLSPQLRTELLDLLACLREQCASEVEHNRLRELAADNRDARLFYIRHTYLAASLRWSLDDFGVAPSGDSEGSTGRRALADTASPATLPVQSNTSVPSLRGSNASGSRRMSRFIGLAASIAVIAYFGALAAMLGWDRYLRNTHQDRYAVEGNDLAVAMISNTADVHWSPETTREADNAPIQRGEPLKIDSGIVQLELKSGATLVVAAPAKWTIDGDNRVSLQTGKLVARVPARAVGFIVKTPHAEIVDLGTEFGVAADEKGGTEVEVFKGEVQLHTGFSRTTSVQERPMTLKTGSAFRVEKAASGDTFSVRPVAADTGRFVRTISDTNPTQIRVQGALASSESARGVNNLVNGSGMKGEAHANNADGTMWDAVEGRIRNEFVLFDLGTLCRLDSMKVWNYNEIAADLYSSRGVAQADIFVSRSNGSDPLSSPDGWKLVVADQRFNPGTGLPTYDTPDVISLDGIEARFVAIVIHDHFSDDPRKANDPSQQTVGLSEVQFFGERLSTVRSGLQTGPRPAAEQNRNQETER
jgi:hypothetical protein